MLKVIAVLFAVSSLFACAPIAAPAALPPTPDSKATEARIMENILATLTASAPTATSIPTIKPTVVLANPLSPTPSRKSTVPPKSSPTPKILTPTPVSGPTRDPLADQIPKGMSGIIIYNYVSNHSVNFTIQSKLYEVPPNDKKLIVLAPGKYTYSINVPGHGGWNDVIEFVADQYQWFPIYFEFNR